MSDDPLLGKQVGNYVVTSLLGRGGMGEVYVGEHPKIGRKVAVKVLSRDLLTTGQLAARFLAEAKAVARIGHPNVIQVFDFGTLEDGRLYYMMELLQGSDLQKVLQARGRMSAAEIVPYLEQICAGLQAAHECGVIHRDMKPENVFVVDGLTLQLKLLDFGIAKVLETKHGTGLTSTGIIMGTPLFIAPEQALGQPERITPRTDLYSLGVMLYSMLAGRPPFLSEATAVLLAKHIQEAPPPLRIVEPSVAHDVAAVIERCLEKDPLRRFASAAELASSFAAAVSISASARDSLVPPTKPDVVKRASSSGGSARTPTPRPAGAPATLVRTATSESSQEATDGSSIEEDVDELPQRPVTKWVAAGAAAVVLAVGAVVMITSGSKGESPPAAVPGPASGPRQAPVAPKQQTPSPVQPPSSSETHVVSLHGGDARTTCRVRLVGGEERTLAPPCRVELAQGKRIRFEVIRRGKTLFAEEWEVTGGRIVDVVTGDRIVDVVTGDRPSSVAARHEPPSPSKADPVIAQPAPMQKPTVSTLAAEVKAEPEKKVELEKKTGPEPQSTKQLQEKPAPQQKTVGTGTMAPKW